MRRPEVQFEQYDRALEAGLFYLAPSNEPGATVALGRRLDGPRVPHCTGSMIDSIPVPRMRVVDAATNRNSLFDVVRVVDATHVELRHPTGGGNLLRGSSIAAGTRLTAYWSALGSPGLDWLTDLSADAELPAVGQTVEIRLRDTADLAAGDRVAFSRGWSYGRETGPAFVDTTHFRRTVVAVVEVLDATRVIVRNDGTAANPSPGTVIPARSLLVRFGVTTAAVALNTLNFTVDSTAWMSLGQMLLVTDAAGLENYSITSRKSGFYFVQSITDGTHFVGRRPSFPGNPSTAGTLPAGMDVYPARVRGFGHRSAEMPYAVATESINFENGSATEVILTVDTTAWMQVGMRIQHSPLLSTVAGADLTIAEVIDEKHVRVALSAGTFLAGWKLTWGSLAVPYAKTTAAFTVPHFEETVTVECEDTSWMVAERERPDVPIWLGHPVQNRQVVPAWRIGDRWFGVSLNYVGAVYRVDGDTGKPKWTVDWDLSLLPDTASPTGAVKCVTTDGTKIFAGGTRASRTGLAAGAYTVRALDGDGRLLWEADTGGQVNQLLIVPGTGLVAAHKANSAGHTITILNPSTGTILSSYFVGVLGATETLSVAAWQGDLVYGSNSGVRVHSSGLVFFDANNQGASFKSVAVVGSLLLAYRPGTLQTGQYNSSLALLASWTAAAPLTADPDGTSVWGGGKKWNATTRVLLKNLTNGSGEVAFLPDAKYAFANGRKVTDANTLLWSFFPSGSSATFASCCAFGSDVIFGGNRQ